MSSLLSSQQHLQYKKQRHQINVRFYLRNNTKSWIRQLRSLMYHHQLTSLQPTSQTWQQKQPYTYEWEQVDWKTDYNRCASVTNHHTWHLDNQRFRAVIQFEWNTVTKWRRSLICWSGWCLWNLKGKLNHTGKLWHDAELRKAWNIRK